MRNPNTKKDPEWYRLHFLEKKIVTIIDIINEEGKHLEALHSLGSLGEHLKGHLVRGVLSQGFEPISADHRRRGAR